MNRSQTGLGMNEMAVACVVLAVFFITVSSMVTGTNGTRDRGSRASRIVGLNQRILDQMQCEVSEAVEIFEQNDIGVELFENLQKPEGAQPIGFTSLPRVLGGNVFGRELRAGARTGNSLMFAKWERNMEIDCNEEGESDEKTEGADKKAEANAEGNEEPGSRTYKIDVYRLVCYYLTPVNGGPSTGSSGGLNLFRFISEGLADATQIEAIEDEQDQQEVLRKLVGDKVTGAWRRDVVGPPVWFVINPSRGTINHVEFVAQDPVLAELLLDPMVYSVASNYTHDSLGVGEFGVKTNADGGFPHGFEVQMMGPASSRELMLHLTLVSAKGSPGEAVSSNLRLQFVAGK